MSKRSATTNPRTPRPSSRLLLACVAIVFVWGWFLPLLSTHPAVKTRLEFLDARGIDPSAMYYTDLDAMDKILERHEGQQALQESKTGPHISR